MTKTTFSDLRRHYAIKTAHLEDLYEAYMRPSASKIYIVENLKCEVERLFKHYDKINQGIYTKNASFFTYSAVGYDGCNCITLYATYRKAVMIEEADNNFFIDYFDNYNGLLYYSRTEIVSRTDES